MEPSEEELVLSPGDPAFELAPGQRVRGWFAAALRARRRATEEIERLNEEARTGSSEIPLVDLRAGLARGFDDLDVRRRKPAGFPRETTGLMRFASPRKVLVRWTRPARETLLEMIVEACRSLGEEPETRDLVAVFLSHALQLESDALRGGWVTESPALLLGTLPDHPAAYMVASQVHSRVAGIRADFRLDWKDHRREEVHDACLLASRPTGPPPAPDPPTTRLESGPLRG